MTVREALVTLRRTFTPMSAKQTESRERRRTKADDYRTKVLIWNNLAAGQWCRPSGNSFGWGAV